MSDTEERNPPRGTTRAERRAARLDDPRFDRVRTPTMRRRLVVAMAGLIALEAVLLLALGAVDLTPWRSVVGAAVFAGIVVAFVLCLGALKASTRGVEELGPDQLDERQMQVRGLVFAQAYKIGSGLVVALLAAALLWSMVVGTYPPSLVIVAVLLVTFHVTLVLPTLVAAWHERV